MDYLYQLEADGTVTITRYLGTYRSVTVPKVLDGHPVRSIGTKAFYRHKNLAEVTIPEGVTHIGDLAFYQCSRLMLARVPASVTSIGTAAFGSCGEKNVWVENEDFRWTPDDEYESWETKDPYVCVTEYRMEALVVPGSYAEVYFRQNCIATCY